MLRHHMLLMFLILKALVTNAARDKYGNSVCLGVFFPAFFPLDMPRELFAKQTSLGILIIMRYPFTIRCLLQMIGYYASLC